MPYNTKDSTNGWQQADKRKRVAYKAPPPIYVGQKVAVDLSPDGNLIGTVIEVIDDKRVRIAEAGRLIVPRSMLLFGTGRTNARKKSAEPSPSTRPESGKMEGQPHPNPRRRA